MSNPQNMVKPTSKSEMKNISGQKIDPANHETVLILQGGGSLGAYECGVYKSLYKHEIKFDIVAGTSIGAINALFLMVL